MTYTTTPNRKDVIVELVKQAAISARVNAELAKTQNLRKNIVNYYNDNSLVGGSLNWLKKKNVPGGESLSNLYLKAQDSALTADTAIGSVLRGDTKPESWRYKLFTNSKGFVPTNDPTIFEKVPRASITKPLTVISDAAVPALAYVGYEALQDEDPTTYKTNSIGGMY